MTSLLQFLKNHEKACLGLSLATLVGYLMLRNNKKDEEENKNQLQTSLKELIKRSKDQNIKKIVITSDSSSQGNFRRNLVSYIKTRLIEQNIKVLINCSPQKLLNSGCECFLQSMEQNDNQYIHYYQGALKAQYLIQDTIVSIQTINQGKEPIIMICDNNPLDIKLMNDVDSLWEQTLEKNKITESEIKEGYDVIIHAREEGELTQQDLRIASIWKDHKEYHQVVAEEGALRQKYDQVYSIVTKHLNLPENQNA